MWLLLDIWIFLIHSWAVVLPRIKDVYSSFKKFCANDFLLPQCKKICDRCAFLVPLFLCTSKMKNVVVCSCLYNYMYVDEKKKCSACFIKHCVLIPYYLDVVIWNWIPCICSNMYLSLLTNYPSVWLMTSYVSGSHQLIYQLKLHFTYCC